jgi:hypothetical protein
MSIGPLSEPPRTDLNGGRGTNQKSPEPIDTNMVSEFHARQLPPELPLRALLLALGRSFEAGLLRRPSSTSLSSLA